jgi:hypothetical protein
MSEWHPPTEDEKAAVHELVVQLVAELRAGAAARARITNGRFKVVRPLPDVTLKGEALRKSRAARGLTTPLADEVA